VRIPAQQDVDNAPKIAAFRKASDWLACNLTGDTLADEQADLNRIAGTQLDNRVIHFATHGTFPRQDSTEPGAGPYSRAGLVLAGADGLPSLDLLIHGTADERLLTPERSLGLDFSSSHVTMHACVSGLAREGIGGDALGMEWALLQAGAVSLLSTHWDISIVTAADFCVGFYQRWLKQDFTRARAWRETVLEAMDRHSREGYKAAYHWAGLSLSGDWR